MKNDKAMMERAMAVPLLCFDPPPAGVQGFPTPPSETAAAALVPGAPLQAEMPIFVLELAVCPGGMVPLHIFEMRYRQMMNKIAAADNKFGMLVRDPSTGKLCEFGTVLEVVERQFLPDGRQFLLNLALERFRILSIVRETPYMVAQVELGIQDERPKAGDVQAWGAEEGERLEDVEQQVWAALNAVVRLMNKLSPPTDPGQTRSLSEMAISSGADATVPTPHAPEQNLRRPELLFPRREVVGRAAEPDYGASILPTCCNCRSLRLSRDEVVDLL
ncbi:unnamed protein product [Discosporangium mesarthrocarpum]